MSAFGFDLGDFQLPDGFGADEPVKTGLTDAAVTKGSDAAADAAEPDVPPQAADNCCVCFDDVKALAADAKPDPNVAIVLCTNGCTYCLGCATSTVRLQVSYDCPLLPIPIKS
jgi:hypothetical protein